MYHVLKLLNQSVYKNNNYYYYDFQHRDSDENNPDTPFEFTAENMKVNISLALRIL